jgi:hypothetical protein
MSDSFLLEKKCHLTYPPLQQHLYLTSLSLTYPTKLIILGPRSLSLLINKNKLRHIVYGPTRVNYGLGAQLACCARDKAAEAVRAARANGSDTCPTFKPTSSIRYDARTYRRPNPIFVASRAAIPPLRIRTLP